MEVPVRRPQLSVKRKIQPSNLAGNSALAEVGSDVEIPLVVDLDGTLIYTDLFWESLLALLKTNIFLVFVLPIWLIKGKASLKNEIAKRVALNVANLPYNRGFLAFLQEEYRRGRRLVLNTASDRAFAVQVATHLGFFSEVLASDGKLNLKGAAKARALCERFGDLGFEYAGNEAADLQVWAHANGAVVVNASNKLVGKTKKIARVSHVFETKGNRGAAYLRVIRPKHWVKNALIFVPIVTSQELTDLARVLQTAYAFIAFSLIASAVYILNDLADLDNDRQHHEKRERPFASGEISLCAGIVALPVLVGASVLVSLCFLPSEFLILLAGYFILNIGYSLYLKQVPLVDVLMLALFYSWRVVAGGVATHIALSHWLLVFSVFMFLSLAFAKRVSELQFLRDSEKEKTNGRGYLADDLEQLASFGVASGYIAVLVFALYINSPGVKQLYTSTETLWVVCPLLLYWVSRLWLLVHRRQMPEDPVVFVCRDRVSYVVGIAIAISLTLAN